MRVARAQGAISEERIQVRTMLPPRICRLTGPKSVSDHHRPIVSTYVMPSGFVFFAGGPAWLSPGAELTLWLDVALISITTHPSLQILLDMGFEFGEVAQMTDEWENRFDQLLEWMLWNREEVRHSAGAT